MRSPVPHIGSWYKDLATQHTFEVVAIDTIDQTIEVQMLDGDVDEYDMESWSMLELISVEEPEDWLSPYQDDYASQLDHDIPFASDQWGGSIDTVEPTDVLGIWEDA